MPPATIDCVPAWFAGPLFCQCHIFPKGTGEVEILYLGRIVAVASTPSGRPAAVYRVSSRSFPNRMAKVSDKGDCVSIIPKPGFESDLAKNPYIAYNCARLADGKAILANGSQTDPIAEKIAAGMPVRDAVALSLLALDYEKDEYDTPRVVAVASPADKLAWLGSVRKTGLDVVSFRLAPGTVAHVSTYEHNIPLQARVAEFAAETAAEACRFAMDGGVFASFANPVTAVAAVAKDGGGWDLAAIDVNP